MFLTFINSTLYFIKKINTENSANAAVIKNNGINIEECIVLSDKTLIDEGWCKVAHQSTEYLIIGTLITPIIEIYDEILTALFFSKSFQDNKYKK